MLRPRIIPHLLLDNGDLVKTRRYAAPVYIGDPINAIRIFNEKEVDEIIVIDIGAKRAGRAPNFGLIEEIAGECFMPLCYGGGISTIEDAKRLFSIGVEKVCVQSAALRDLTFISRLADLAGSQAVVVSIDIKKNWRGEYCMFSAYDKRMVKDDWQEFIAKSVNMGAGEIILASVDREGEMNGMDTRLISMTTQSCPIPIIAAGGVGEVAHQLEALAVGASAIAVGSFFVFAGPHRAVLITYSSAYDQNKSRKQLPALDGSYI